MDIFSGLNDQQFEAVVAPKGPLLIIAGAGSGKTHTLIRRIAYQIRDGGIHPSRVMAVTFTKKAAKELQERLAGLLGEEAASQIWAGTFHSICLRILREYHREAHLPAAFSIYDAEDSDALIKEVAAEFGYKDKGYVRAITRAIEKAKAYAQWPSEMQQGIAQLIYQTYQDRLYRARAIDFGDMIVRVVKMLERDNDIRRELSQRFELITVDEYQDTNVAQLQLIKLLSSVHRNITVIGDDQQSIYGFRYANIENILTFDRDYEDANIVKLEQNYRSTERILEAANSLISYNKNQWDKTLWTNVKGGPLIQAYYANTAVNETKWIVDRIKELMQSENGLRDIAILYRMNFLSADIEQGLRRAGIPYKIVRGIAFFDRLEIKDLMAYIRLLQNPHDDMSFERVINTPRRGIGDKTIEAIKERAKKDKTSLYQTVKDHMNEWPTRVRGGLEEFIRIIDAEYDRTDLSALLDRVLFLTNYTESLKEKAEFGRRSERKEARERLKNIDELKDMMTRFTMEDESEDQLAAFLAEVTLMTDQDDVDSNSDKVQLMTIHAAKGLEFENVFVIGMDDGILPSKWALEEGDEDEERRLAYVAITRAKHRLYLTFSKWRHTEDREPSRFLNEIPSELIDLKTDPQLLAEVG